MKVVLTAFVLIALTAPAGATTHWNIDQMSGWQKCTICSSQDSGPGSFSQWIKSPSMDGNSMHFRLGGSTPYRNSLWFKSLSGTTARHFAYNLYFYIKTPGYAQALEFDINQYIDGRKYLFGHQCDPKRSRTWDVYDYPNNRWVSTGIPCPTFQAYKWNHVIVEVERTWDKKLRYVAITYNGKKHYVNKYMPSGTTSWYGLSVSFQMDGDYAQHDYSTWLDRVKLSHW